MAHPQQCVARRAARQWLLANPSAFTVVLPTSRKRQRVRATDNAARLPTAPHRLQQNHVNAPTKMVWALSGTRYTMHGSIFHVTQEAPSLRARKYHWFTRGSAQKANSDRVNAWTKMVQAFGEVRGICHAPASIVSSRSRQSRPRGIDVLTLCTRRSDHRARRGACRFPGGFRTAPRVFCRRRCRKVVPSSCARLRSMPLGHRLTTPPATRISTKGGNARSSECSFPCM